MNLVASRPTLLHRSQLITSSPLKRTPHCTSSKFLKPVASPSFKLTLSSFVPKVDKLLEQGKGNRLILARTGPVVAMGLFFWGGVALAAWLTYKIVRLAFADADLHLLSEGPPPKDAFKGKVVWITGASQGIGAVLARQLAEAGALLILSARSRDNLQAVADTLPKGQAYVLPLDISASDEKLTSAVEEADKAFGDRGVDLLIHNAAYARPKTPVEETTADVTKGMFAVNVVGCIALTKALLPKLIARKKGRFVVVSSAAGRVPSPLQAVYAASKHALHGYFNSLKYEVTGTGVGVTLLVPGPIASHLVPPGGAQREVGGDEPGRMSTERCVELMLAAIGHELDEAWISPQPVLAMLYATAYLPALAHLVLKRVGPSRVRRFRSGEKDEYTAGALLGMKKTA